MVPENFESVVKFNFNLGILDLKRNNIESQIFCNTERLRVLVNFPNNKYNYSLGLIVLSCWKAWQNLQFMMTMKKKTVVRIAMETIIVKVDKGGNND